MKTRVTWIAKRYGGIGLGFHFQFPEAVVGDYSIYKYWFFTISLLVVRITFHNSEEKD